jgi:hypothetical protein
VARQQKDEVAVDIANAPTEKSERALAMNRSSPENGRNGIPAHTSGPPTLADEVR